ncbi:molybdopterin converting factor [Paenibacillus darwinianus]|uniref:Molybdopterin synthase catalytic subunit n=1 Tax=Paenibacillus darwinianus TaxID=1380763 RepID=A0A9W5S409_9BACL|nr:molybdenum cofactor biosynthesis protein MoaE [Paenibacillus darwinianus]EXX91578.1 molybdopterin converting factor [Paenibacillus darwinianus]EXX91722.1 molybdopterin converting factor [Paenibacillus darwinianus]EXX92439.1 molybdopterin converting factor [Paenibacillus darwinianus]
MMKRWTIHLFAGLAERLGSHEIILELESEAMTVKALKAELAALYPEHEPLIGVSFLARNQQYASDNDTVGRGDELAMLPPVSGGEDTGTALELDSDGVNERYTLTDQPLEQDKVASQVIVPAHGASLVFVGTTREWTHGKRTARLEYEAYAPMALRTMRQIGDEIGERWPGSLCAIAHRTGIVDLAEASVIIAVSAPHRDACYEASRYAIERLKQIVPIWKKEIWEDGSEWKGHQLGPWDPTTPSTV